MLYQHRRRFAFALAVCLLFGLLPGTSRAEPLQTEPAADTPAAETVETNVPAVEMPTDTYEVIEAEQVSLSESEIRVIKGGTTTLTAELPEAERGESPLTTSSAIVWTSSNPEVATVDSNGVVTGVDLGEATITATLNGSVIETFSVYSTLADGYYRIDNPSNTYCFYPSEISMYYSVDVNIAPITYLDDTLSAYYGELQRKWYIEYLDNGYYAIHPAYSSGMVLSLPDGTSPVLQPLDSANNTSWHWNIVSSSGNYSFVNRYHSDQAITFPELDDTIGLLTSETYTSSSFQRWNLVSTTVSPGLLLFDMRSGDLVGDDLHYNGYEVRPDDVGVYVGACLNQAYALDELGLYLQPLEIGSYNRTHTMTFSNTYATFNLSTLKITGTQTGYTDAEVKRAISGTLYKIKLWVEVKQTENLTVKYDYAYANRYTTLFSRLSTHTQAIAQKFRKEYNIFLNISTPTGFRSYGDMCPNSSYSQACNCSDTCSDATEKFDPENHYPLKHHHKNAYNIYYSSAYSVASNTLQFIGHNVCRVLASGHQDSGLNGLGDASLNLAQVYNHQSLAGATRTAVHETGHLFEIEDHYDLLKGNTATFNAYFFQHLDEANLFSKYCIYGEKKDTSFVTDNLVVCTGCRKVATGEITLP